MMTEDNGCAGPGWRYCCKTCGHELGIDKAFPEKCPGCQAGGWWGNLTAKTPRGIIPAVLGYPNQLCHGADHAAMRQSAQNNGDSRGVLTPEKLEGRRGPKFKATPDDLILELSGQGNRPKEIAMALEGQGIRISARTVHRRLQCLAVPGKGGNHDGSANTG